MKHKQFCACVLFWFAAVSLIPPTLAADEGVAPVGRDGKPFNLNLEVGTLKDWIATGKAFEGQPVKDDTVSKRRTDMKSQHAGDFWIGTYEIAGDGPKAR